MNRSTEITLSNLFDLVELGVKKFIRFLWEPMGFHVKPADMRRLRLQRFNYPHPLVRRLFQALYFRGLRLSMRKACRYAGVSPQALRLAQEIYLHGGLEELKRVGSKITIHS